MKIDFLKHEQPASALNLDQWLRDQGVSEQDAADAGIRLDEMDAEYEMVSEDVDVVFASGYEAQMKVRIARATVSAKGDLKSLRLNTPWATPESVATIVSKLAKDWDLVAFEEVPSVDDSFTESLNDQQSNDRPAPAVVQRDAIAALQDWVLRPTEELPAYVAQTKEQPSPEIVILRVMILPQIDANRGLYCVSVQAFWVAEETPTANDEDDDPGFSERINEVVLLANKQAENESVTRVTDSLVYAAARYAAFAHWSTVQDKRLFEESREEVIENCVHAFRIMLIENLDEHLEMFDE